MQAERSQHKQVRVKINARVDAGIAPLVSALSAFPWIETVDSCEGQAGDADWPAHVFFSCGDWQRAAVFVHAQLAPALARLGISEDVRLYARGCGDPLVEARFPAEATPEVTSAVIGLLARSSRARTSGCCDGTSGT